MDCIIHGVAKSLTGLSNFHFHFSLSLSGRSLKEENGYPLQYSCLDNSMDRRAFRAIVHGATKSHICLTFSLSLCKSLSAIWLSPKGKCSKGHSSPTSLFLNEVTHSCPTLCNFMDCSLPGSSIHRIFQARILEWVAISFSRGSSWPRDQTRVPRTADRLYPLNCQGRQTQIFLLLCD